MRCTSRKPQQARNGLSVQLGQAMTVVPYARLRR
jgi:hypothetical protein